MKIKGGAALAPPVVVRMLIYLTVGLEPTLPLPRSPANWTTCIQSTNSDIITKGPCLGHKLFNNLSKFPGQHG